MVWMCILYGGEVVDCRISGVDNVDLDPGEGVSVDGVKRGLRVLEH